MLVREHPADAERAVRMARSLIAAGWRCTLIGIDDGSGRVPTTDGVPWHAVDVEVRAGSEPMLDRRAFFRAPLAYGSRQDFADGQADAAVAEAEYRIDLLKVTGRYVGIRRAGAQSRRALARLRRAVVDRRVRSTQALRATRRARSGVIDRLALRWWEGVLGDHAWGRLDPRLWDLEMAFAPVLDDLEPDVLHVHHHQLLHVAVRAKLRAAGRRSLRVVWDLATMLPHDIGAGIRPGGQRRAYELVTRDSGSRLDGAIVASESLRVLAARAGGLPDKVAVISEAPETRDLRAPTTGLRAAAQVSENVPLLVYSGHSPNSIRTVVRALAEVPDVHLAVLVRNPRRPNAQRLLRYAEGFELGSRVHLVPRVSSPELAAYLAEADVGVVPVSALAEAHALPASFYEYAQAALPIVASDVGEVAGVVRRTGHGELFRPGDPTDAARAIRVVLDEAARFQAALRRVHEVTSGTWEEQAPVLVRLYEELTAMDGSAPSHPESA